MRIFANIIVSYLCLLCFVHGAYAQEKERSVDLSLNTIILFALDNNPDLQIAQERIHQMEAFADEARASFLPRVEVFLEGGRQTVSPTSGDANSNFGETSLRVTQQVFQGFKAGSEVKRRESLTDSFLHRADSQRQGVILETVRLYLSVLRFQSELRKLYAFVREIDQIVSDINEMFAAGEISKVMNDYAVSRQAAAYLEVSSTQAALNDEISNLEFLTGPLPEFTAVLPDQLVPEKYAFDLYFELAESQNSIVKTNEAELKALRHQLNVEKAAQYPDVDLNLAAERTFNENGDTGTNDDLSASFTVRYEIFDGFLNKNKKRRVGSEIRELEIQNQRIRKELRRALELSYHQILSVQNSLASVNAEIQNSITVKTLNAENFRLGNINAIELIEGEERLKDAYRTRDRLLFELNLSKHTLLIDSTILEEDYFCLRCSAL